MSPQSVLDDLLTLLALPFLHLLVWLLEVDGSLARHRGGEYRPSRWHW